MRIAIISYYDSAVWFSIYLNGTIIDRDCILGYYNDKTRVISRDKKSIARRVYTNLRDRWDLERVKEILNDYDKIFLCEDGNVEELK